MNRQPTKDELRLSATQIAELASCEARFYWRWKAAGKPPSPAVILDRPAPKPQAPTPDQQAARERGIAEHARFHDQVTRFHNTSPMDRLSATQAPAPSAPAAPQPDVRAGSVHERTHHLAALMFGEHHPCTQQLRRFRDRCLRPHRIGRALIARHDRTAPAIAIWLSSHPRALALTRTVLEGLCVVLHPWTKENTNDHASGPRHLSPP
jgi:hypothetical protein